MRTLAIVGTAGGVGTTTLAALAFNGLRSHPQGAPMLYARPSAHALDRAGGDEVTALNGDVAIWDAGPHAPESAAALLEAGNCSLAVAAPATALGVADARAMLSTLSQLGEAALAQVVVVLSQVNGPGRMPLSTTIPGSMLLKVPFDRTLAKAGPLPPTVAGLGGAKAGVAAWQHRATGLLLPNY